MYNLTKKCLDTLDILEYSGDRVFNNSSTNGWTIGKTRKFIALGMTKEEGVKKGFLEILPDNPLRELCKKNEIIPYKWIQDNLTEDQYDMFLHFMKGQGQSTYGVFNDDLLRFLTNNQI